MEEEEKEKKEEEEEEDWISLAKPGRGADRSQVGAAIMRSAVALQLLQGLVLDQREDRRFHGLPGGVEEDQGGGPVADLHEGGPRRRPENEGLHKAEGVKNLCRKVAVPLGAAKVRLG